ncbi:MAG: hypothetical protein HPY64_15175 [Anaerolineae bacterium]|nr:hypothetical protein [Anaerolineae bacterium]
MTEYPTVSSLSPEPPAEPRKATRRVDRQGVLIALLLLLVMGSGAYFRFIGQNWDDFTHLHPDERFLTQVVTSIAPVSGIGEYFNTAESSLNPNNRGAGFYVYGTLPLFIVKAATGIVAQATGDYSWVGYNGAHLVGRTVSAVADLLTILFVFLIGRRLYDRWIGLLAAALYAWAVLPIQLAHFWTMDAFTGLAVTVAVWLGVRILDEGGWGNYAGFGLALGAAVASRINVAPLAIVAALAALVRVLPALEADYPLPERRDLLVREGGGLVLAALVSVVVFRLAQPYAFAGPSIFGILPNMDWWRQMQEVNRQVSGQADFPPNHQWASRIPYLFSWQNMVLWGMGLPLGLTAWVGWAAAGWQILRGRRQWMRHLLPFCWVVVYYGWQGGGWVMTMRYYMPLYPLLALFAAWALITLVRWAWVRHGSTLLARGGALALLSLVTVFTLVWAFGFTRIYTRQLTRVQASHWILQNIPADFSFTITAEDGRTRMINVGLPNDSVTHTSALVANATRYFMDGDARTGRFILPDGFSGTVTHIHAEHLGDPNRDSGEETLWVGIVDALADEVVAEGRITADFSQGDSPLGQAYDIPLDNPVTLVAGRHYEFRSRAEGGAPIIVAGAAIATEGPWDDPIPWKVCALPDQMAWSEDLPPGLVNLQECNGIDGFGMGYYQGLELYMAAEDNEQKRATMQEVLDGADYLTISSNRFYDSLSRLPMRFPMSLRYYRALFSGELGFELVRTFESTFTFGNLVISDQVLPTYDVPAWLNEFEAEEAFHVYDHPVVFVFHKRDDYDPALVARVLNEVSLASSADQSAWLDPTRPVGVIQWNAKQASAAPTALMFTDTMREIQYSSGTWSELYDANALINRSQLAAVVAWWGLLVIIGWATWPLLFALLPALPDRAFPLAKVAGLLLVSWLAWLGASLRLPTWSRGGLLLALLLVLIASAALGWRRRGALAVYVRAYWRQMLILEGLAALLFLVFLGVRLGNPDLWHPNFGGERPMDFAYLNGVLRSTIFPPINPWFSGGYINYYYYGFVLVGVPIKLLGLFPSVAFNLILATLFSLTGMAAFSVAFNLVGSWRKCTEDGRPGALWGNPWVAGGAAMLLAVMLGNLDDIRLIITALARTGGWRPVTGEEFLPPLGAILGGVGNLLSGQPLNFSTHWWYWNPTRVMAHTGNAITEIPYFTFLYGDPHAHAIAMPLTLLVMGWLIHEVLVAGQAGARSRLESGLALAFGALAVGILQATNFADWVTYLVLSLFMLSVAHYLALRAAHSNPRGTVAIPEPGGGWRALGMVGGAPLYLAWQAVRNWPLTWADVGRWAARLGAFVALGALFLAPYTYWYATADAVPELWQGPRTPLWAYLDLNGLFLFLVVSLLIWDTARWLRTIHVRDLAGRPGLILIVFAALAWAGLIIVVAALLGYTIALIALPVALWAAILFFRPGQARPMRVVWALVVLAVGLTFVVDVVVWAGDIGRQNTVFKFYMQVWLLLSVVGGAALAWLLRASADWPTGRQGLWRGVALVLLTIAGMYPLLATQAKFIDRMAPEAPHTLDGMAFMPYATQGEHGAWFSLAEDYDLIRWMQANIKGTPVVLEGQSEREYLWGGRISVYTGLPTIIGYNFHQRQQRTLEPLSRLVGQRIQQVNTIYDTTDIALAWRLLQVFDVSYIVVGQLERAYYLPAGLDKFEQMAQAGLLELVYQAGDTRLYAVRRNAAL